MCWSRRLERECSPNVEVMWLPRRLAPDFKTIADFRRDNGTAIVGACRAFVLFCRDQGLFTARLVALDGSKFRAVASAKCIIGRREIAEETARLNRRLADYLAGLDETDAREPDEAGDRFLTSGVQKVSGEAATPSTSSAPPPFGRASPELRKKAPEDRSLRLFTRPAQVGGLILCDCEFMLILPSVPFLTYARERS